MSVFTKVDEGDLGAYLARFNLGRLDSFDGIESGIENTNYLIYTDQERFVLTLVEQFSFKQSRWFIDLVNFIYLRGFPVPQPIADRNGVFLTMLAGKPAVLTQFIEGGPPTQIDESTAHQLGRFIGYLHSMTRDYRPGHPLFRDVHWCRRYFRTIHEHLNTDECALIKSELQEQLYAQADKLPGGAIHADLFRDNVFFDGNVLSGFIDFWHSGIDSFIYELAVACNDWCWQDDGYRLDLMSALFRGYYHYRRLNDDENCLWPMALRRSALRFWLSRLGDSRCARDAIMTHQKNPDEQYQRLRFLLDNDLPSPQELCGGN